MLHPVSGRRSASPCKPSRNRKAETVGGTAAPVSHGKCHPGPNHFGKGRKIRHGEQFYLLKVPGHSMKKGNETPVLSAVISKKSPGKKKGLGLIST